jgi:hypothetical protein
MGEIGDEASGDVFHVLLISFTMYFYHIPFFRQNYKVVMKDKYADDGEEHEDVFCEEADSGRSQ